MVNARRRRTSAIQPPLIVVDFGTATTFDVVNDEGSYCGGAIAPGINLSLEALHQAAAKLPRIAVEPPRERDRHVDHLAPCSPACSGAMSA